MARQMMNHTAKTHSLHTVSYFAEMARNFAGFYWYAYFCSRYRKPDVYKRQTDVRTLQVELSYHTFPPIARRKSPRPSLSPPRIGQAARGIG